MSAIALSQKRKAEEFLSQADKVLSKSGWFTNKDRKNEDAVELLEKAANAYKVGGFHHEAGDVYTRAASIHRDELKNYNEASKCLTNAGKHKGKREKDCNGLYSQTDGYSHGVCVRCIVALFLFCCSNQVPVIKRAVPPMPWLPITRPSRY